MSRYVDVELGLSIADRGELIAALAELGLEPEQAAHPEDRLMLAGSLECAGEPVDLRLAPGTLDCVEDFGFVVEAGRWRLVCGELDRRSLEAALLGPLRQALALGATRRAAAEAGLELELEEALEADGTRRIRVRDAD